MKRSLLIISFLMCLIFSGIAQGDGKEKGSRVEALKIAFLTKKLDLSTEEAQRFWPIYNQYSSEISDARNDKSRGSELETEEKILKIRKKYNSEFTKALNAEKANNFFTAEKDFLNMIKKVVNERREEKRKNRNEQ